MSHEMDALETEVAEQTGQLADALLAEDFYANVWYDEDGDEGWHITIEAGEERPRDGGGSTYAYVLAFWTRDETWYWERTSEDGRHTGPWPHRTLDNGSTVAEVVEVVRVEVEHA